MARERFYVEVTPGYVRLRHQLGLRTQFGRGRLTLIEELLVEALERAEESGEPIEEVPDDDMVLAMREADERERLENECAYMASLDPVELVKYLETYELAAANKAAAARLGRGRKECQTGVDGRCGAGCCRCRSRCSVTGRCGSP